MAGINVPYFCKPKLSSLIHFCLAVLSSTGERINRSTRLLTCTRVETTAVKVCIMM
jgi:hypothetical protein